MLAKDCAALQPGLLRKACDRVAQTARGLPYASEILAAAAAIVAERQAAQASAPPPADAWGNRAFPNGSFTPGSDAHREWVSNVNRYQASRHSPSRLVLDEGAQQARLVWLSDGWRCNGDGSVTPPTERGATYA